MKKNLTHEDMNYIENLKDYLSEIQYGVYKKGNTYIEVGNHLLPFEKNNQQFIHHFTQDVINETQLYTYKIRSKRTYSEDFSSHIYQSNVSPWLMLKTIQSFDDDGKTLRNAIKKAINHQDFNFAFECFSLPQSYIEFERKHMKKNHHHPLNDLVENLIGFVQVFSEHKESFHQGFTEHIQYNNLSFPPFYVLKNAGDKWTVAVENTEPHASLKVQTLLTQLVHSQFSLNDDDSIEKLTTFIEKIHLEFNLNTTSNKKTQKNKI